jgi:hypothetical protein
MSTRYDELVQKRDSEGLSRQEADELGKLMAERRGEPYGNADNPPADVQVERVTAEEVTSEDLQQVEEEKEAQKRQQAEKAETAPKGSEQRPEERPRLEPPKPGTEGPPTA